MTLVPDYDKMLRLFDESLSASYRTVENGASFAVKRKNAHVTVFFEDSEGALDWRNNFRFAKRPYRKMGEVWYCHSGFLSVFRAALPYLEDLLLDESVKSYTVVGYSHGAALALLCHEYLWFHRHDVRESIEGYGFGCPRVVGSRLTKDVRKRWERFWVIRNLDDIVTHLPPRLFGYRHVNCPLPLGQMGRYSMIDAHRPENYRRELLFAAQKSKRKEFAYDG